MQPGIFFRKLPRQASIYTASLGEVGIGMQAAAVGVGRKQSPKVGPPCPKSEVIREAGPGKGPLPTAHIVTEPCPWKILCKCLLDLVEGS